MYIRKIKVVRYTIDMFFFTLLHHYLWWHYSASLVGYIRVSRNFWWYFFHIFSVQQLTLTLFSPYKRVVEYPSGNFSLKSLLERTILNFFSRLLGSIIRISILIVGISFLLIFTFVSLAGFAIWLGAPLLICFSMIGGICLLFI